MRGRFLFQKYIPTVGIKTGGNENDIVKGRHESKQKCKRKKRKRRNNQAKTVKKAVKLHAAGNEKEDGMENNARKIPLGAAEESGCAGAVIGGAIGNAAGKERRIQEDSRAGNGREKAGGESLEPGGKLFQRDFAMVVIGQIISLFGNNILRFALPLYLLQQTGSAALFGLVSACSFLPVILLSPIGGIVADRVNKRNIMVVLDFATAALIFLFCLGLGRMPLVPLLVASLMILYGIQGAYQPAVQASLPLLVREEKLMPANAVINQVNSLAGLLGPVVGGVVYGAWGLWPILGAGGLCFVFSAVLEIFIRIPFVRQKQGKGVWATVREDMGQSLDFIRFGKPELARIIGLVCAFNLFMSAMLIIGLPVLITQTLGMSSGFYGFSLGMMAAGGLVGGILAGVFASRLEIAKAYRLLIVCGGGAMPMGACLLLGLPAGISYGVITAMGFLLMAASTVFTIQMLAFVQMETPPDLIGKVISCLMAMSMCAQPVGQALYGALFEYFKQSPWVVVIGASLASLAIAALSKKVFGELHGGKTP